MMTYFTPINKYMLRVPLQPNSLKEKYGDLENNIESIANDKYFCEQILVASENIYNSLVNKDFSELPKKKQRNLITSLGNYINRASTRTTPFGLFTGVAIQDFSKNSAGTKTPSFLNYQKHSRIDAEWLFRFIKKIELENYSILKFKMNTASYRIGNRLYIPYTLNGKSQQINVNYSKPLAIIEELCSEKLVSFQLLVHSLKEEYPERDISSLTVYLKTLIEKEFLISEVRPPVCNTDLLTYTINQLKENPELYSQYGEPLDQISSLIIEYNNTAIGEGTEFYLKIQEKMRNIFTFQNEKHLQVDTELKLDEQLLSKKEIDSINKCINILMKFASNIHYKDSFKQQFEEYRLRFIEKFGTYVEVPIYEVIDEIKGIGALKAYSHPKNKFTQDLPVLNDETTILKRYFMDKYLDAIENKHPIVITEEELDEIGLKVDEDHLPNSLELNFILRKDNCGENLLYLGPNIGSSEAGKTFGRFSYMMNGCQDVLEEIEKELADPDVDDVELSFIPSHIRMANVTSVNSPREYNISLYTNSYKPNQELALSDILVGFDDQYFYLKNKKNGRLLNVTSMNMLNLSSTSNVIRLLSDISLYQSLEWSSTPWSVYYQDFIHIPEIRYEQITLSNEKWSLQSLRKKFEGKADIETFKVKFGEFKNVYSIPNEVYLQFADNRILLDLSKSTDFNLLFKNFFKFPSLTLEKAEAGKPGLSLGKESYSAEVVVPFVLNEKYRLKKKSKSVAQYGSVYKENRYLPFNDWLFLKLYGPEDRQDELIDFLHYFLVHHLGCNDYEKFFFMRYSDPKPHIRLRFKSVDSANLFTIYTKLNTFFEELRKVNILYEVEIGTYFPEVNRYGGPSLIPYAEDLFYQDSLVVMNLLEYMRTHQLNKEQVGVITLLHYLNDFQISYDAQLHFLEINLKNDSTYKKQYKEEPFDFINTLDSYNNWDKFSKQAEGDKLLNILEARRGSITAYLEKISSTPELTSDLFNIIGSVIHLHFNRLFVIDREFEDKLYSYAYHTLYGQRVLKNIEQTVQT
ncbi:lantibiotic dehydratase [Alkalihalobacterium chitinilyticum]|uniref:Lantibiotic dehydratase n=1 Tax=Alkalihalobacterium chitinilyticum TaxID=2980103 RepID=A0ABT5VIM2_9BACI|nr:lantibiotic dehydratase [Alkalihalobacterium chitinilyticum]MDE5415301.1 lantibiotic dehydratase [Alkalihalobacterium chitinilyticum]